MASKKRAIAANRRRRELQRLTDRRLFLLHVQLTRGPVSERFAKRNPVVSRTIAIRADQTLEQLHWAIYRAFGRWEDHLYEFQCGKGPQQRENRCYGIPTDSAFSPWGPDPARSAARKTIRALNLSPGSKFWYWFDFGDDWWHEITVMDIQETATPGDYPKVIAHLGESPPQYLYEEVLEEEEDWEEAGDGSDDFVGEDDEEDDEPEEARVPQ